MNHINLICDVSKRFIIPSGAIPLCKLQHRHKEKHLIKIHRYRQCFKIQRYYDRPKDWLTKTCGSWIWPSCSMLNEWGSTLPEGRCKDDQTNLNDKLYTRYSLQYVSPVFQKLDRHTWSENTCLCNKSIGSKSERVWWFQYSNHWKKQKQKTL